VVHDARTPAVVRVRAYAHTHVAFTGRTPLRQQVRPCRGKLAPRTRLRASQKSQEPGTLVDISVLKKAKLPGSPRPEGEDEDDEGWQPFNFSLYSTPWDVPWGIGTVVWGLVGWGTSFILTGAVVVPLIAAALGIRLFDLSTQQQTYYVLGVQGAETVVGLCIIDLAVKKFKPLPEDFFRVDFRGPFKAPNGWLAWGLLGYMSSFGVVGLATGLCSLIGYNQKDGGGTVDSVAPLVDSGDPTDITSLLLVTSVLAPVLEETVFRGFLLTSLTKFMPNSGAVVISSLVFAFAHFAPKDAPQLFALGLVLGTVYTRTRNLLAPMTIHSLWNSGVLLLIVYLQALGYSLEDVLGLLDTSATLNLQ